MNIVECKCPSCSAKLDIDTDKIMMFCPYCGTKLMVESEQISKVVSEKEETKRQINSYEYEERKQKTKYDFYKKIILIVLFAVAFLVLLGKIKSYKRCHVRLPYTSETCYGNNYLSVRDTIRSTGFNNIDYKMLTDSDISKGDLVDGDVVRIEVDGKSKYRAKKKFDINKANIVICFYSPDGMLKMPFSSETVTDQSYWKIKDALEEYGYKNIQTRSVGGILDGLLWSGDVISMTVSDLEEFSMNDRFSPDVPIVITYFGW